ncbi:MAG: hypothetical protein GY945_03285 [Rhodobacteraceae bacterium]|nr:hypothetical protein [Paracoccaceae bacterium]
MDRVNKAILTGFLVLVTAVLAGAAMSKGGFFIGKHEGDTLHLLQMVLRMAQGDWPHLDFVTPIGLFAFLPIVAFLKAGFGVGHAFLYSQLLVAIVFLPAIWWVSFSRFKGVTAYIFGAAVLVLILALVHGEEDSAVSVSMHYNRWAWAAAFLVIATIFLPNEDKPHPFADGVVLGLGMAVMALIKVTYFAGFAAPVLVGLIGRKAGMTTIWAVLSGLMVMALVTLAGGTGFWVAYFGDLMTVSASQVRPQPSLPLIGVIGSPAYMGGSILLIAGVIFLRQAGRGLEGLMLLLLAPGFFYVTFQNSGNDPQWLGLFGVMLLVIAPNHDIRNGLGWDLQKAVTWTAIGALAMASPSFINLAYSPFRHMRIDPEKHVPLLQGSGVHEDLQTRRVRAKRVDARVALDGAGTPFEAFTDPEMRDEVFVFQEETLPNCYIELGVIAWFSSMSADLRASGLVEGKTVFTADLLSSFWLFGAFEPLPGGSPWYYGGLPGFEAADYVIVPFCPMSTIVRGMILTEISESGVELVEIRRNEMFILYEK